MQLTTRLGAYASILVALVSKVATMIAGGWTATDDDATIALRVYNSLRGRGPLVGQYSELTLHGQPIYDAGPLPCWLMATPRWYRVPKQCNLDPCAVRSSASQGPSSPSSADMYE